MISLVAKMIRGRPALARAVLRCVPDVPLHIRIPEIGRLRIHARRNRSLWLRPPLTHEAYPLAILRHFVKPGDTVWDCGANIGLYTRWIAGYLHAGRVVAFEPGAANLPELIHNVRLGSIEDRVKVVPWALSDVSGFAEFQVDDMQSASGSLDAVRGGKPAAGREALGLPPKTETVETRTIDEILRRDELPAPDVLKIDVEGAELLVLRGGVNFLTRHNPRILIETHGAEVARDCLTFLLDRGYSVAACVPPEWNPGMHMRLGRALIAKVQDQYDAHFIAAARDPDAIPDKLDYARL